MMRSRLRPFAPLAWRFVPARRALSTLPTARYEAWRFVSARRALSTLPTARYEALVSSGKLTRDPHQLAALSALDRVWRELDGYAVPDVKEEATLDQNGALMLLSRRGGDRLTGCDRADVLFVVRGAV